MDKTLEGQDMPGGQLRCTAFQLSCAQEMSAKQIVKPWGYTLHEGYGKLMPPYDTDSPVVTKQQINLQIRMAMVDIQVEKIFNDLASGWLFPIQFCYNIMPLRRTGKGIWQQYALVSLIHTCVAGLYFPDSNSASVSPTIARASFMLGSSRPIFSSSII